MLGGETVSVSKFPHFAVGGAVVGSVADLHLSQGVFGGFAVDKQGEVGLFACSVVISAQRLAIKAIFAAQGGCYYGTVQPLPAVGGLVQCCFSLFRCTLRYIPLKRF